MSLKNRVFAIIIMLIFIFASDNIVDAQLANSEWPLFRHDLKHTGHSQYIGTYTPTLKWMFKADGGFWSSPVIGTDGTIYVGSEDPYLYAINPNGTQKWKFKTNGSVHQSSPAIGSDGTIYVGATDYYLYAINPDDGSQKWKYYAGSQVYSAPSIGSDGTIYVGSHNGYLNAINSDGTLKWKYSIGAACSSSAPAIGTDGTIYIGSEYGSNGLCAVKPDGSLKWKFSTSNNVWSSPSIGADGTVYFTSMNKYLYAINPVNGLQIWNFWLGQVYWSSPAIGNNGPVYIGTCYSSWSSDGPGDLYAINLNGTQKWKFPSSGGFVMSSPAIGADETIYIGSGNGYLYAINPDGTEKWKFLTGGAIHSSPTIGKDGTIYFGSDDHYLYAIGEGNPNAITLENFTAHSEGRNVILSWTTGTEIDNLGFYIIRSENVNYGYTLWNKEIIPSQGNAYSGYEYSYVDSDVEMGQVYYYWLADLDVHGEYEIHGPVNVITNLGSLIK